MKNTVVVGIGSNINAAENIKKALIELKKLGEIKKESRFVETKPIEFEKQDNFTNGAVLLITNFDFEILNNKLKEIEKILLRIKTSNKNGPRTIDLDILVFNNIISDKDVYEREFLQESISEITDIIF